MKILHTCARFPPYIGGTEKAVHGLCKELVSQGADIEVICANLPSLGNETVDGIKVTRLPVLFNLSNSPIIPSFYQTLAQTHFDILHTHLPHPFVADLSHVVARRKSKPLFLSYYNDIVGSGIHNVIAELYNRLCLPFLLYRSRKIFIGQQGYLDRSRILRRYQEKVIVTPLGVDTDFFRPAPTVKNKQFTIFFQSILDSFHKYKGLNFLLEAIKRVSPIVDVRLHIGGEGELKPFYQKMAADFGLLEKIAFPGFLSNEQLLREFQTCDVFVLPSTKSPQEGFGLVALEAMACGKPIIVTDSVAVSKTVKSCGGGIVVPPEDVGALSEAILKLAQSPDLVVSSGHEALRLVHEHFSWKIHGRAALQEYLSVFSNP